VHGYPMVDSDFLSLASYLKNWLKEGVRSRATKETVAHEGASNKVRVLEMYRDSNPNQVLKRVFVDSDTFLPVEWHDFEGDTLKTKSSWSDVKTNTGLSDDLFKMNN
jgi:outer membrane lipoprotein-sorting protein